jgi:AP2-like factor (ANT lineage)
MQAEDYSGEMSEMEGVSREEYLASLRRRSSGFSRGVSKYRGVARYYLITSIQIKPPHLL